MRRALSVLLLAIFSLPLFAQALALNPAPNLPACCRRAGVHHCTMDHSSRGNGPQLAQLRCQLFPQSGTVSATARISAPASSTHAASNQLFGFTTPEQLTPTILPVLPGSLHKRGPPSFLN